MGGISPAFPSKQHHHRPWPQCREMRGQQQQRGEQEEKEVAVWDCGSPLYDSFELASLCHIIDRHLMSLPFYRGSGRLAVRPSDEPEEAVDRPAVSMGKRMVVMGSWSRRGGKETVKKKSMVGLLRIFKAIAFWKKE